MDTSTLGKDSKETWGRGEEYVPAWNIATVKHGRGSIMVWGCMSAGGIGQLTVGEGTMNSPKYCQILEHQLVLFSIANVLSIGSFNRK